MKVCIDMTWHDGHKMTLHPDWQFVGGEEMVRVTYPPGEETEMTAQYAIRGLPMSSFVYMNEEAAP